MIYKLSKTISVLFCAVSLAFTGAIAFASGTLLGDVDNDGRVTIMDATILQWKLADISKSDDTSINATAADIDSNGEIEIMDATYIQRRLASIETPYPIGVLPTTQPTLPPTDEDGWGREIIQP